MLQILLIEARKRRTTSASIGTPRTMLCTSPSNYRQALASESAEVINSAGNDTGLSEAPTRRIRAGRLKAQIGFRHSSSVNRVRRLQNRSFVTKITGTTPGAAALDGHSPVFVTWTLRPGLSGCHVGIIEAKTIRRLWPSISFRHGARLVPSYPFLLSNVW